MQDKVEMCGRNVAFNGRMVVRTWKAGPAPRRTLGPMGLHTAGDDARVDVIGDIVSLSWFEARGYRTCLLTDALSFSFSLRHATIASESEQPVRVLNFSYANPSVIGLSQPHTLALIWR